MTHSVCRVATSVSTAPPGRRSGMLGPAIAIMTALLMALAATLCACTLRAGSGSQVATRPGDTVASPGGYTATLVSGGKLSGGVEVAKVRISDSSGTVVFQDTEAYSLRHGVGVAWQASGDVLWILSADVGTSKVSVVDGRWTKVADANRPPEIEKLR